MNKINFLSLLVLVFVVSCAAQQNTASFDELLYKAHTRGTNISITIKGNDLVYVKNQEENRVKLTKDQLGELHTIIADLKLDKLIDLKAPSEKRITDGALHGEFVIIRKDKEYESCGFDAGNPPQELKKLEDYLYKLSEKK